MQLFGDAQVGAMVGRAFGFAMHAADVEARMAMITLQEGEAMGLVRGAAPYQLRFFSNKGQGIAVQVEVAHAVEFEDDGGGVVVTDGAAFDEGGRGGYVDDVAVFIEEAIVGREVAQQRGEVVVVGGGAFVAKCANLRGVRREREGFAQAVGDIGMGVHLRLDVVGQGGDGAPRVVYRFLPPAARDGVGKDVAGVVGEAVAALVPFFVQHGRVAFR